MTWIDITSCWSCACFILLGFVPSLSEKKPKWMNTFWKRYICLQACHVFLSKNKKSKPRRIQLHHFWVFTQQLRGTAGAAAVPRNASPGEHVRLKSHDFKSASPENSGKCQDVENILKHVTNMLRNMLTNMLQKKKKLKKQLLLPSQ